VNAEEFKEYMSKEKRDRSYLMAFASYDWETSDYNLDDVHPSDDLLSDGTWEIIDIYFSKRADLMFIWRNDGKELTDTESTGIHEYVVADMEDYTSDGEGDWHKSIHKYLESSKKCLILSYDKSAPDISKEHEDDADMIEKYEFDDCGEDFWSDLAEDVKADAIERAEKIAQGETDHDKMLDVLTGKKQKGQEFDDVYKRRKK
jgi:DNA-directed RNA polymerase subunit F